MASADFLKLTRPMINGSVVHFDECMRVYKKHSNKDIDPTKSHLNETYGAASWQEVMQNCLNFVDQMDELYPPKRKQAMDKRIIADYLYVPCPLVLTEQGLSKDFFDSVWEWMNDFFGGLVSGGQVHRDEIHTYMDHGIEKISLEHGHYLLPAYARWQDKSGERQGINGKNFNTPEMYKAFQDMLQVKVMERYGISYQTGAAPRKKTVEELKQEPMMDAFQQLPLIKKELDEAEQKKKITDAQIAENEAIIAQQDTSVRELNEKFRTSKEELAKVDTAIREKNNLIDLLNDALSNLFTRFNNAYKQMQRIFDHWLNEDKKIYIELCKKAEKPIEKGNRALETLLKEQKGFLFGTYSKQNVETAHKDLKESTETLEKIEEEYDFDK